MPHRVSIPSYRLHKASGQAVVTLDGRDCYLGKHGSEGSRAKYDRLVREYLANDRRLPERAGNAYTVGELCSDYLRWCRASYVAADGTIGREVANVRVALKDIVRLFLDLPAAKFGPRYLLMYRQEQIRHGLTRKTVNQRVGIVKRAFRWACQEELIPPTIHHALMSVSGLKRGRAGGAKENEPVRPVPLEHIDAALPFMPAPVQAMVKLQLLTGARPGEIVILRFCDIDCTGPVWVYRPRTHKNAWRGQERTIPMGERCQDIIRSFLRPGYQERYLFSPREAVAQQRAKQRAARRTPVRRSHLRAKSSARKSGPSRAPRECYDTTTYARAIRRACEAAGIPIWSPGRLRHNAANEIRQRHGLEAAKAVLGHRVVETTQIYSENDARLAELVALDMG